jgi:hypothetical protein
MKSYLTTQQTQDYYKSVYGTPVVQSNLRRSYNSDLHRRNLISMGSAIHAYRRVRARLSRGLRTVGNPRYRQAAWPDVYAAPAFEMSARYCHDEVRWRIAGNSACLADAEQAVPGARCRATARTRGAVRLEDPYVRARRPARSWRASWQTAGVLAGGGFPVPVHAVIGLGIKVAWTRQELDRAQAMATR